MNKIYIVAEIGCNHNGDVNLAKKMVLEAKRAGVDAVKFQTFIASKLVSKYAQKAEYQKKNTNSNETQLDMISNLELTREEYLEVKNYSESLGLCVFSTAFDLESIDFLNSIGQRIWKIPSGEITNLPYLEKISELFCDKKEIILSTGMANIEEIKFAVSILEKSKNTNFTILHCNTDYPTKDEDMNLLAISDLKENFPKWKVGLSDHSQGILAPIICTGLGISFLEKHFTIDKNMNGPDHKASITPEELSILCKNIRKAEIMLGNNKKKVTNSEKNNIYVARKSIVAKSFIKKGEILNDDNITCKRPGNGINPIYWHDVIGRVAEKDFDYDELITCSGIEWEESKTYNTI